jgi:hypothetical protein
MVGGKTGEWIEPGFEVTVAWRISGTTLERTETVTAHRDVSIKRLSWLLPRAPRPTAETAPPASRSRDPMDNSLQTAAVNWG